MAKRSSPISADAIRQRIRDAGLRRTPARVAVLSQLARATSPMTHAELATDLAGMDFDQATIYRNLVELAEAGLILRFELGDHVWRFEYRGPQEQPSETGHPHFLCVECGAVSCLPDVSVKINPAPGRKGSTMSDVTGVLLRGHCINCG